MGEGPSRIERSKGATVGYAVGGLVSFGLSALLFWQIVEGAISFGIALVPGILALILFGRAIAGSGVAPCPGCGARITGLSTKSNDGVHCTGCKKFSEGKEGNLQMTPESRVADTPLFSTALPDSFTWPEGCCVCTKPATQREPISISLPSAPSAAKAIGVTAITGGVLAQTAGGTKYTVQIPHCGDHKDGASLGALSGARVRILFRSYPYLRSFCELNKTSPE